MDHQSHNAADASVALCIGGTGIIGRALQVSTAERGLFCISLSLDPDWSEDGGVNLCLDANDAFRGANLDRIIQAIAGRPVVAIVDLLGLQAASLENLVQFAQSVSAPVGILSTCMLYDHDGAHPVDETASDFPISTALYALHG